MNAMTPRRFDRSPIPERAGRLWRLTNAMFTGALIALLPRLARACPVCFAGSNERVLPAYYLTAAFMILLPLAIVGLFAGWLRQRFKNEPK